VVPVTDATMFAWRADSGRGLCRARDSLAFEADASSAQCRGSRRHRLCEEYGEGYVRTRLVEETASGFAGGAQQFKAFLVEDPGGASAVARARRRRRGDRRLVERASTLVEIERPCRLCGPAGRRRRLAWGCHRDRHGSRAGARTLSGRARRCRRRTRWRWHGRSGLRRCGRVEVGRAKASTSSGPDAVEADGRPVERCAVGSRIASRAPGLADARRCPRSRASSAEALEIVHGVDTPWSYAGVNS